MAYTTIDDPSAHFQTALWTGNGNNGHDITNDGNSDLQPDLLWIKNRGRAENHTVYDSTTSTSGGTMNLLHTDGNFAQSEDGASSVSSFNSDGFTVNAAQYRANYSGDTFVGWQWKANGGTTSSDTNGAITSTVQANATAGISIMKFTSAATTGSVTVGHGLGAVPSVLIMKDLVQTYGWDVHHISAGSSDADGRMTLNNDSAWNNAANVQAFGDYGASGGVAPTSTVFTFHQDFYGSAGDAKIVFCFTPIQGYSAFNKYTGNGNVVGPFVYLGFKPAWLMIKRIDSANSWYIVDTKRNTYNVAKGELEANNTGAEATSNDRLDILSNGFKIKTSGAAYNADGGSYSYMAFAEQPIVTSTGIPATAR